MKRRYAAELLGTFGIVFAPVALSATSQMANGAPGLLAAALVSGLAVLAMICALGPISAHFNPAVTIGFASAGHFSWRYVLPYIVAQLAGAILATGAVTLIFGAGFGTHIPASADTLRNVGSELILSFFLMLVIIAMVTDRRVNSTAPAIAIGLTVMVCVLIGGPVTGGSMNPARSLAPALFSGGEALKSVWLYLAIPPIGAILATRLYKLICIEPDQAKDAPSELSAALKIRQL